MLLNMLSKAVNANPVASIDFIFTIDKSRLLFLSFSSSRSIFFLCCLSSESPSVSFRFSTNGYKNRMQLSFLFCFIRMMRKKCVGKLEMFVGKKCVNGTYVFCFAFQFQSLIFGIFLFDKLEATSIL